MIFLKIFDKIYIENETKKKLRKGVLAMKVKFIVEYNDDFNRRHITFATSMAEVKYIEARFLKVKVTPCSKL